MALNLTLMPPNVNLFDYNSPLVSGDYASSLVEDINLEAQIRLFNFLYVGGSVGTITHDESLSAFNFVPTYEKYTFDAGIDYVNPTDKKAGFKFGWIHECIHPTNIYKTGGGTYEGSYDLLFTNIYDHKGPFDLGFEEGLYLNYGFEDYSYSTVIDPRPLMFTGSYQKIHLDPFYLAFDEKVYLHEVAAHEDVWKSLYSTFQAEAGIDLNDMVFGVRWNNVDPLAPLLWAEGVQITTKGYFSVFMTFKLETER